MDGRAPLEAVPGELASAAPIHGVLEPQGGTAMAGAVGNCTFTSLVDADRTAAAPPPPPAPPADRHLARQLASTVRERGVARAPWESVLEEHDIGGAASYAAMEQIRDAQRRAQLPVAEKELADLQTTKTVLESAVMPTMVTAAVMLGTPDADAKLVNGQLKPVRTAIAGLPKAGLMDFVAPGALGGLEEAVNTLDSVDEPRDKTIADAKEQLSTAITMVQMVESLGAAPMLPEETGGATVTTRIDAGTLAALAASREQLKGVHDSIAADSPPATLSAAAGFVTTAAGGMSALGGIEAALREPLMGAVKAATTATHYLKALGRDKAGNIAAAQAALLGGVNGFKNMPIAFELLLDQAARRLRSLRGDDED